MVTVNGPNILYSLKFKENTKTRFSLFNFLLMHITFSEELIENMHYSCSLLITSAERTLATQASVVWHGFIIGCSTLLSALHKATMLNWWSHKMLVGHSRSCKSAVSFFSTVQFKCHFDYKKKNISNF